MYKKKYLKYKLKYLNLKNKLYGGSEESRKTISDRNRKKCLTSSDRKEISKKSEISRRKFLKQAIEKSWQDTHPEELYDEKLDNWMSEFDEKGKEEGEEAVWRSLGDDAYWRRLDEEAVRRDFGEEKGEEDEVSKGELLPSQPTKPRPPNMKTYSGKRQQCRYIHEQNLREKEEAKKKAEENKNKETTFCEAPNEDLDQSTILEGYRLQLEAQKNPAYHELCRRPKSEPYHQPQPPPPPCPSQRTPRKRNPKKKSN